MFDRIRNAADIARFRADQLVRINRLNGEVQNLNGEKRAVRTKIADVAIRLRRNGVLSRPELDELCDTMDQLEAFIAEKEEQIAGIRAEIPPRIPEEGRPSSDSAKAVVCPSCGFAVPIGAAFCPECGLRMPETPEEQSRASSSEISSKCLNCGFGLPAEAQFCPNCGQAAAENT